MTNQQHFFNGTTQLFDEMFNRLNIFDEEFWIPKRYVNGTLLFKDFKSRIIRAYDIVENKHVAIKKISNPFGNVLNAKRVYREFCALNLVNHCNIIKLLNAYTPQQSNDDFHDLYLVTELMEMNLTQAIDIDLSHSDISFMIYQLLCGIYYLHRSSIIHRNLTLTNIVINNDCKLKILDFGLAKNCNENLSSQTPYVTQRYYRAPEVILSNEYDEKIDVWAIGCIFGELIKKDVLFPGSDAVLQWRAIVEKLGSPGPNFTKSLPLYNKNAVEKETYPAVPWTVLFPDNKFPQPDEDSVKLGLTNDLARDLLSRMLVIDPSQRISVEEALKHPYVNVWYNAHEFESYIPSQYNQSVENGEYSVEQWKSLLFNKIKTYESCHNVFGFANYQPVNIGHNYIGHNYIGHNYIGHNYIGQQIPINFDMYQTQFPFDYSIGSQTNSDSGISSLYSPGLGSLSE